MEEALIAKLIADSGVAAIAAGRVYPGARPQGAALPAIVLHRIDGAPLYADEGEAGLAEARIQIDCWATTYGEAKTLARAVTGALSGFAGTVAGTVFQFIELDAERDLREGGAEAADYPFRTALDFLVWTEQ